ncbi:MAG: RDD family protein [Pseudomonadales bacterium]
MAEQEPKYTGFWWRVLAAIIDSILVSFLLYPILFFVLKDPAGTTAQGMIVQIMLPAIAFIAFWQAKSSTPGKMAIGAIIVDAKTSGKPTTKQWIIRYLGYYVSTIPLMLGLFWVGFDKRKQGWHDKLAGTVVIFKDKSNE